MSATLQFLRCACVLLLLLVLPTIATAANPQAASAENVRATITKSLPYLESAGQDWIEKRKCISCHRVTFMT